jgi:uncharacterized protein with HEPN domain
MPSKRPDQRFRDIVENIDLIVQFTAGMSFDQYLTDVRTRLAIERCLSIIAEAARKLGTEAEIRCPEIRWIDIRALGNRLRHEYPNIRHRVIWKIVTEDIGALRLACERQLQS